MKYYLLLLGMFLSLPIWSEESIYYRFRVYLKDKKGDNEYQINKPEDFLSNDAIQRRSRYHIPIKDSDLPIPLSYKKELQNYGFKLITESKWHSTIVLESIDSFAIKQITHLSFVDSVKYIWKSKHYKWEIPAECSKLATDKTPISKEYGYAQKQIQMLKGNKIHKKGFKGKDMKIAIIDAGFIGVNRINAFSSTSIAGTHNVVYPGESVYAGDEHGTKVLSCLAANIPNVMIGTAPEATFWLIKSEDSFNEFPIEEDYWTAAVEYADSVGIDIITSSLGYFSFDDPDLNYKLEDLNGNKSFISKTAELASEKGILVFSSAGNEGNSNWKKITVPADARGILTVGAVTGKKVKSSFSSIGYSADGRVKPDVSAMGSDCCVINEKGKICFVNGTSFSTPILAGLGACLWQALPELSAKEIRNLIRENASQYKLPDEELGYGIPDIYKSYKKGLIYVRNRQ